MTVKFSVLCAVILAIVVPGRAAEAQERADDVVCVAAGGATRALTNPGGDTRNPGDDPEPKLCDARHWQTLMIFTGLINGGFAWTAAEALLDGKRLGKRFSWAMFIASAPQAVFGMKFLAEDLTDGSIDYRDGLLLGSVLISTAVAAYSGWSLLSKGKESQRPPSPGIRVGAAPLSKGLMLGASGSF